MIQDFYIKTGNNRIPCQIIDHSNFDSEKLKELAVTIALNLLNYSTHSYYSVVFSCYAEESSKPYQLLIDCVLGQEGAIARLYELQEPCESSRVPSFTSPVAVKQGSAYSILEQASNGDVIETTIFPKIFDLGILEVC